LAELADCAPAPSKTPATSHHGTVVRRAFNLKTKTNSPPGSGVYYNMKNISMLARRVGLLALGAGAPFAFGLTTNDAYIASYRGRTDIPVPVTIVAPVADTSLVGEKVEVEFVVDASGQPKDIQLRSSTDGQFGEAVREAVSHWKFIPAAPNGVPMAMKVRLPVVVTESD
jgi:TonB family protein